MGFDMIGALVNQVARRTSQPQNPRGWPKQTSWGDISPGPSPQELRARARGGAGRDVPRMKVNPQRAAALQRMRQKSVGQPTTRRYQGVSQPLSPEAIQRAQRLRANLNRRGIKGKIHFEQRDSGGWDAVGPRGKHYKFPIEGQSA